MGYQRIFIQPMTVGDSDKVIKDVVGGANWQHVGLGTDRQTEMLAIAKYVLKYKSCA